MRDNMDKFLYWLSDSDICSLLICQAHFIAYNTNSVFSTLMVCWVMPVLLVGVFMILDFIAVRAGKPLLHVYES